MTKLRIPVSWKSLKNGAFKEDKMYWRKNQIMTFDKVFGVFKSPTYNGTFWNMGHKDEDERPMGANQVVYVQEYYIHPEKVTYIRKIYDLLNFMRDFGSMLEAIPVVFLVLLSPFAKHSYHMKAIQSLYTTKSD